MKNRIIAFYFVLLLVFGAVFEIMTPDREYSEQEKRNLMQYSDILKNTDRMGKKFGDNVEKYLTDQYPKRDSIVTIKTAADILMGKREAGGVFIGKDNYLIDTFSEYDKKIFNKNIKNMAEFRKKLAENKISCRELLVPASVEIMSNKLPQFAFHVSQEKLISEVAKKVPGVIDITSVLKAHNDEQIYYKSDHHWTSVGAYYAYVQWKKSLGKKAAPLSSWKKEILCDDFKGTTWNKVSLPGTKYQDEIIGYYHNKKRRVSYNNDYYVANSIYENSYLKGKDKYGVFFNSNQVLTTIQGGGKKGKLLLIKDSYANTFAQFVIDDYKEVQMIDMRFFRGNLASYVTGNKFDDVLILYGCSGFATEEKRF